MYTIGTVQFFQCPLSVFAFDPDVIMVADLVMTSLESGIPVTGTCLLDQTKAFFDFNRIIRDERRQCHEELEKVRKDEDARNRNKQNAGLGARRPGIIRATR